MSSILNGLYPEKMWFYFEEICKYPRPSKKEEKIAAYLVSFGKAHNLETITDDAGNVLIRKPATKGKENLKTVILQSHIDMVCEKNSDTVHDFENDPIQPYISDGWIKAKGTTLGADDGIGMAAQLAILESKAIEHGPIECLFTVDEETGLTGAFALKPGFLKGNILLNLDSEDEGQLYIGCAGGKDTQATFTYHKEKSSHNSVALKIMVSGLKGGHSGDDINKGLANSNKILNRLLWKCSQFGIRIASIDGGNLRNAIPREAYAIVTIPESSKSNIHRYVSNYERIIINEYKATEQHIKITCEPVDLPEFVIDSQTTDNLLNALYACPHGVIAMSAEMPELVETSTNLATIKMVDDNLIKIGTSQRSSVDSAKQDIVDMVTSVFLLANARIQQGEGYPGWQPNLNSEILKITKNSYKNLFNKEPKVLAIHAGLECGLIGEKFPKMDMISFGPTLRGVHSPDERLDIESVKKFWNLIVEVLKNIPKNIIDTPTLKKAKTQYNLGLVLSGGGARGFAHIGVLKALNEAGIYPDIISAVSAGSIVGAFYADGYTPDEIFEIFSDHRLKSYLELIFPKKGLLRITGLLKIIKQHLRSKTFETLKIPLIVSATDLIVGETVYFTKGDIPKAIIASASIPVLFIPFEMNNCIYVDGGVLNNLPVEPIKELCRIVIGVHVNPTGKQLLFNSLANVAERAFHLSIAKNVKQNSELCDFFIEPQELSTIGIFEVSKSKEIVEIGYNYTKLNFIDDIKKMLLPNF